MPVPPSLITNLSLGGVGLLSAGGLAYGGYELLKDRPKPMSEFLSSQKRVPLSQNPSEDQEEWKTSWKNYKSKYGPKEKPPLNPKVKPPEKPEPNPLPEEHVKDIWGLEAQLRAKQEAVPPEFKQKCKEKGDKSVSGTWTKEFKEYLDYCTKNSTEDE